MNTDSIKLVTLNVRGLRSNKKYTVFKWLTTNEYDIALLQETYCTKDFVDKFKRGWRGDIIHSPSKTVHSAGVCILLRKGLEYKIQNTMSIQN